MDRRKTDAGAGIFEESQCCLQCKRGAKSEGSFAVNFLKMKYMMSFYTYVGPVLTNKNNRT